MINFFHGFILLKQVSKSKGNLKELFCDDIRFYYMSLIKEFGR